MGRPVVLLTGPTGFLGRHILDRLMREDVIVHAVSRTEREPSTASLIWHTADLLAPDVPAALAEAVRPTHCLHNAWMAVPGRFWSDPSNIQWMHASVRILEALADLRNSARFFGVGSCAEYDWTGESFAEDETATRPATLYGAAKAATLALAQAHAAAGSLSAAWGRIFLPYGPGDTPGRLLPLLVKELAAGREMKLGDGSVERDFIYAPDAADLIVRLLLSDTQGVFNVGSGQGTTIERVALHVADHFGRRAFLHFRARDTLVPEPRRLVADMRKVERTVGWRAPTPLAVGLDCAVQSILEGARSA